MVQEKIKSYRDLIVWQRAIQLFVSIYKFTKDLPQSELYGLITQLRRASVSVASNIAEGHGRMSTGEYKQFLGHARGSLYELQTQLVIARELQYGNNNLIELSEGLSNEVGKMLNAVLASVASK